MVKIYTSAYDGNQGYSSRIYHAFRKKGLEPGILHSLWHFQLVCQTHEHATAPSQNATGEITGC